MCLLTFMPEYVTPDPDRFDVAAVSNPDGFGWAIVDGKRIIRGRGMNYDQVFEHFSNTRRRFPGPAMFHFRWATHGVEDTSNCHPFTVGRDEQTVVGHNGILPVEVPKGSKRSDTAEFALNVFPSAAGTVAMLDMADYLKEWEDWARGSKLVFLTANPDAKSNFYILNEADGHWDKDMWWSNHSYVHTPRYLYDGYGSRYSHGGGWSYSYSVADSRVSEPSVDSLVDIHDLFDDEYDDEAYTDNGAYSELEQLQVFCTDIGLGQILVECYTCTHTVTRPADYVACYCDECGACLFCGLSAGCNCWHHIESTLDVAEFNYSVLAEFQQQMKEKSHVSR